MELVLGVLVVLVAVGFVVLPLVRGPQRSAAPAPAPPTPAEQRAEIYHELLDLELDQRVGKIDEADFKALSDALLARAAELIAEEDARLSAADRQVEAEIAAMREALRSAGEASGRERQP